MKLADFGFNLGISANDELCAICESDIIVKFSGGTFKCADGCRSCVIVSFNHNAVLNYREHTLKDYAKALTACVNNARLFKHRQKLRSDCKRIVSLVNDCLPYRHYISVILSGFDTCLISHSCNRENCSLCRFHNSLVSGINTDSECCGKIFAVNLFNVFKSLGKATED